MLLTPPFLVETPEPVAHRPSAPTAVLIRKDDKVEWIELAEVTGLEFDPPAKNNG